MSDLREKVGVEIIDDGSHVCDHVSNRGTDVTAVALQASLLKDYADQRLSFHFHFGLRPSFVVRDGEAEPQWLCAEFQRAPLWAIRHSEELCVLVNGDTEAHLGEMWTCDEQQAVFIDVVEFREHPERVAEWVKLPSLVRLQRLDCCQGLRTDVPTQLLQSLYMVRSVDRKNGEVCLVTCDSVSGDDSQLTDQVIQAGTKVVNGISDRYAYFWRQIAGRNGPYAIPPFRLFYDGFEFYLRGNGRAAGQEDSIKVIEVLFRPLNFQADADEGYGHTGRA